MSSTDQYDIQLVDTAAGFDRLRDDWKRLERETSNRNITLSYDWLRTWWEVFEHKDNNAFGYRKQLRILVLSRGGAVAAIAPLMRLERRKLFLKVSFTEFLGQQWGAMLLGVLSEDAEDGLGGDVLEWLRRHERYDVLQLTYIPEYTRAWDLGDAHTCVWSASAFIHRSRYADYEAYAKSQHSKHFRYLMRRARRKTEERGLTCEYEAGPANPRALEEVMRLSQSKLVDGKSSLYLDVDKRRFVEALVTKFPCEIDLLRFDGRAAAYRLGVGYGGGLYAFDTSYDREFRELSPGHQIYLKSIERFFREERHSFYCAGPSITENKLSHYPDVVKLYSHVRQGRGLMGRFVAPAFLAGAERAGRTTLAALAGPPR